MAKHSVENIGAKTNLLMALLLLNSIGVMLFGIRLITTDSIRYWFLVWNLVLAWLPLGFAVLLDTALHQRMWFNWRVGLLSFLWLGFLPNSFYLMSDFVHLHDSGEISLLYDVVMFIALVCAGVINGIISLIIVHHNLLKRMRSYQAHLCMAFVMLATSFAIYLGRSLRWNTWDILINPAGILFDISERIVNPSTSGGLLMTTLLFCVLIGTLYIVVWNAIRYVRSFK